MTLMMNRCSLICPLLFAIGCPGTLSHTYPYFLSGYLLVTKYPPIFSRKFSVDELLLRLWRPAHGMHAPVKVLFFSLSRTFLKGSHRTWPHSQATRTISGPLILPHAEIPFGSIRAVYQWITPRLRYSIGPVVSRNAVRADDLGRPRIMRLLTEGLKRLGSLAGKRQRLTSGSDPLPSTWSIA